MPPKTISKDGVKNKRFDKSDWKYLAEHIVSVWKQRKSDRKDMEKKWKDIDRQLEMRPDTTHKLDKDGHPDTQKAWMPEVELPLQSQTLEITTADARRMQFPDAGPWFKANSKITDEYLDRIDFTAMISGDEMEVPSIITQDNADKLVQGTLNHYHRQYDFYGNMDLINAEAIKYSIGVGRARTVTKDVIFHSAKGVLSKKHKIPVLFPRSIKHTYLDDNPHNLMNEGQMIGGSIISYKEQSWDDLMMAAIKGSKEPTDPDGGWMPKNVKEVEKDKQGNIKLLEYEGDLLVPRKTTDSIYVPNVTMTVCLGDKESSMSVVRFRYNKYPNSSFILFPYHNEHIDSPYGTSPLIKGYPIQKAACEALLRLMMTGALHSLPPISYPADDMNSAARGGYNIYPGAQWPSTGRMEMHMVGDISAMAQVYIGLLQQYADVTGVNAPRLGAQTVSHTTAYAKEAELSRGTVRTVDYVKSTLSGGLEKFLDLEYRMARDNLTKTPIYLDEYGGYVNVSKAELPEEVVFQVYGSGGPAEEQAKKSLRLQGINMVMGMQQLRASVEQAGIQTNLDFDKVESMILRESGITDLDAILRSEGPVTGSPAISETAAPVAPGAGLEAFAGGYE